MDRKPQNKNYGFTLLEVILYLAILSTMVFGIGSFVNLVSVSRVKNQVMTEVDMQAFQIIQNITEDIRNAKSIVSPTIGQNQNSLTIINTDDSQKVFVLEGDTFTVNNGTGAIDLNNNQVLVKELIFKNLSRTETPDIIQINFTISYNNNSGNENYNYSKSYVASAYLSK